MLKNRNILLVLILTIILISIFFIKSSNIQVDSNIKNYTIKCQNCFEYKDTVLSFFDSFRIEVSATGYQTEEFNLSHNDGLNFISLKPNKIKIQFMYDIKPNKVEFLINDIKREFTDEISLVPGDYKIKIISENYYTFEDAITLEASDEIFTINLSDKLIAKNVKFQNSNENIYVLNGSTKIENDAIYQLNKKSTIISHKKNNNVIEYELNIVDNKTEIINLDNIFKNQSIGISIETIPVGAAIRINNTYRGLSPLVINEEEIDKLEISAAGYEDYISTDDNLINDNSIFIELDKILAKVNIKSSPQSDIYINNNYISSTPVSIQLPVGQYNLSLRKKGYATIEKKIIIENRFELTYEEKLLTIKQHALAISPKKYKNQKGIDLILMDPGELMLGSPENEKRRSRNGCVYPLLGGTSWYFG